MVRKKQKQETLLGTIGSVFLVCFICSLVVSASAVLLKKPQAQEKLFDKQCKVLEVAGLLKPSMTQAEVNAIFQREITITLWDMEQEHFVAYDLDSFDAQAATTDSTQHRKLEAKEDVAGIRYRPNRVLVYLVKDEEGKLQQLILPIYGTGLWSVMRAYVAIAPDGRTINGLIYYEHAETPGLGDGITRPDWLTQWKGKKLIDETTGRLAIQIVRGSANRNDSYQIDGLSGATLTSQGVQKTFEFWMGAQGYGSLLAQLRDGTLINA